jgi:hypothetical protein
VLTTLAATQHFLPEFCGSAIFHQVPSEFLPLIGELCPTTRALRGAQAVPGPSRQFTFTSFGNAIGTAGVDVNVGGGVFVGNGVCVGRLVGSGCVTVAEGSICNVGVGVAGILDGKLHASIAKTSTRLESKIRGFIVSPVSLHYLT